MWIIGVIVAIIFIVWLKEFKVKYMTEYKYVFYKDNHAESFVNSSTNGNHMSCLQQNHLKDFSLILLMEVVSKSN